MDVSQSSESLVRIDFNQENRDWLFHFVVMLKYPKHGLRHIVHNQIQINFISLVPLSIKSVFQLDHVGVEQFSHDLELTVFVSFVLVHFFDSYLFSIFVDRGLKHHSKTAITHNPLGVIGERLYLLNLFASLVSFVVHYP